MSLDNIYIYAYIYLFFYFASTGYMPDMLYSCNTRLSIISYILLAYLIRPVITTTVKILTITRLVSFFTKCTSAAITGSA